MYPTTLFEVLAVQFRATLCCGGVIPEPVTDCEMGEFEALLLKVIFPEAAPVLVGAKTTEKGTLFPDGMVTGKLMPLKENSAWLTLAEVTVTGPLLAVRVAAWVLVLPLTTLPKLIEAGETPNCPGAIPVPLSGTESVGLVALEVATRLPLALPPTRGLKETLKVTLWLEESVTGGLIPL